jgi:cytochrome b561
VLLILEIAMLIGGIYALVTAKVPGFLVGGGKVKIEGLPARLLGVLLILPMPTALVGGVLLALLLGEEAYNYSALLEIGIVFGIALLTLILSRVLGKRIEPENEIEASISKKAQGALMYAILSATGLAALVCCPLAIIYANQAIKLIDEHGVGEEHRGKAKTARVIAIVPLALGGAAVVCIVSSALIYPLVNN